MKFTRRSLIFSYGLFTIGAQTLLFREFITTFEGNDISVGIFFASWFLWVGLGAVFVYRGRKVAEKLLERIELVFLCYLPAFVLELILIIQARQLAGIESYALIPIRTMLLLAAVINAPVSIITGMLFPTTCRWVGRDIELPISQVYILEAAGSFAGGLGVTLLLVLGMSLARIFLILAFVLSSSVFAVRLARAKQYPKLKIRARFGFLIPFCILFFLAVGADKALMRYIRVVKWGKLLPSDALIGSFQTAQAEYLYGIYQGQWLAVREGSVVEALPDESSTGRTAAISLCQNPEAKKILVIGSGLGLCRQFLRLPQAEVVTWAHCDGEYVQKINSFIPAELQIRDERFYPVAGDIRSLLGGANVRKYDIVILNLPDPTSSVLNRYYTHQFYRQVKESLGPDGLLAVRIAGGENIMGTELVNLGASAKLTLQKVFSQLVLTPGEDTWFIASDSANLTGDPGILKDRFAAIEGADSIFTASALLSVYLPDRAALALENYAGADLPENLLINRDSRPLTHLYSLLLAAKQSEAPITKLVKHLALAGPLAFLIPVLVFAALRIFYVLKTTQQGEASGFDSSFLVFSAGWIGIGVVISLCYLYQTRFGSLYLHIGVISSVFMVGLTAGASAMRYLLATVDESILQRDRKIRFPVILLSAVILLHSTILLTIVCWPSELWTHLTFAVAFAVCGMCGGCYFPLAAKQLAECGFEVGQAGSKLETADHLGASMGGVVTGLLLIPLVGTGMTLLVFVFLILINIPLAILKIYTPQRVCCLATTAFRLRRLGYALFGIGLSAILCSNLLAAAGASLRPSLPRYAAGALAGEAALERVSTVIQDEGREISYFKVYEAEDKPAGYIFSTEDLAPEVRGFGGRINLAIYVDTAGELINFHMIRSNETPAYLKLLGKWRDTLSGHRLFQSEPFPDVEAVTGATVSSEAVLSALQKSGNKFAGQILGLSLEPGIEKKVDRVGYLPDDQGTYLIIAFVLTLAVIYYGGFWSRAAVLCFNLVAGGIILNAQYSSEQIATVLSLHSPALGLSGAFLLAVGIPVVVIVFGNIYCGYICPFGAAQELLSYVVPNKFKPSTSLEKMRKARFVKYVVLFVLVGVFFLSRNRTTLAAEPLIKVFAGSVALYTVSAGIVVVVALVGSVFYTRFWCRYLCPVGAFLSLLNGAVILKRSLPVKKFGRCEFGLTAKDHLDCIYCDRCRYQREVSAVPKQLKGLQILVPCVLLVAVFVSTVSVKRFLQVVPAGYGQAGISVSAGGQPRDVDLERIQTMIRQKQLSDREAQFYKKIE